MGVELGIIVQSCERHIQKQGTEDAHSVQTGHGHGQENKVVNMCREIISKVNSCPNDNNASIDFDKELDGIKSMFRHIQIKLGAAPLLSVTSSPSTDW